MNEMVDVFVQLSEGTRLVVEDDVVEVEETEEQKMRRILLEADIELAEWQTKVFGYNHWNVCPVKCEMGKPCNAIFWRKN